MLSNHLILCHPLFLLPLVFPRIRVFSNKLVYHTRWSKRWSFNFSNSPFNEYSGLISLRIDWFLLAVQVTLRSLLQHHSLKTSVLRHSAFVMVQLSRPYITIALTIWIFVSEVMSLLFNTLFKFIIAFLPRKSVF